MVFVDHLAHPGSLASDVEVVRAIACAGFDDGLAVEVVWADSVDQDTGFLHEGVQIVSIQLGYLDGFMITDIRTLGASWTDRRASYRVLRGQD